MTGRAVDALLAIRLWISGTLLLCIVRASPRWATRCVRKKFRHGRANPMRRGMRARKTSSAERGEFGKTIAVEKLPARSRPATANTLSPLSNVSIESSAGWWRHKSASLAWVKSVMEAPGFASRRRINAGVVITASPSQLTPRTRIFSVRVMRKTDGRHRTHLGATNHAPASWTAAVLRRFRTRHGHRKAPEHWRSPTPRGRRDGS